MLPCILSEPSGQLAVSSDYTLMYNQLHHEVCYATRVQGVSLKSVLWVKHILTLAVPAVETVPKNAGENVQCWIEKTPVI